MGTDNQACLSDPESIGVTYLQKYPAGIFDMNWNKPEGPCVISVDRITKPRMPQSELLFCEAAHGSLYHAPSAWVALL